MKTPVALSLLVSPLMLVLSAGGPALAASPAYCALYAREYATSRIGAPVTAEDAGALQRVEDQAYYRCLNQDEAPQFPTTSAYFGAPMEDITGEGTGVGGPFQALQIHPKSKPAVVPAKTAGAPVEPKSGDITSSTTTEVAAVAVPPVALTRESARGSGHGAPGTATWVSWCKAHYRSFDETTGFVLTVSGVRKQCP